MDTAQLRVHLIGWTHFDHQAALEATTISPVNPASPAYIPADGWFTDTDGGQALVEFAGRACYQSWNKPNSDTATNIGYIEHLLAVGHLSVLEHGTVTLYLTGVSRSLTHELVRHRHFSYSQLSQRYVPEDNAAVVEPEVIAADPYLHRVFVDAVESAKLAYHALAHALERNLERAQRDRENTICERCGGSTHFEQDPDSRVCDLCQHRQSQYLPGVVATSATGRRKAARQAARAVLPNATETRIVVTGNYRAWRHFIAMRATEHADVEIRALAVACLRRLHGVAPHVFEDFDIDTLSDGTEVAATPLEL